MQGFKAHGAAALQGTGNALSHAKDALNEKLAARKYEKYERVRQRSPARRPCTQVGPIPAWSLGLLCSAMTCRCCCFTASDDNVLCGCWHTSFGHGIELQRKLSVTMQVCNHCKLCICLDCCFLQSVWFREVWGICCRNRLRCSPSTRRR